MKSGGEYIEGHNFDWVVSKAIIVFKMFGFFMDCPRTVRLEAFYTSFMQL